MHCSEGEVVEALDGIEVGQAVHLGLTLPGVNVMYPIALVPPISRSNITITQAPLSFSFNFEPASLPPPATRLSMQELLPDWQTSHWVLNE